MSSSDSFGSGVVGTSSLGTNPFYNVAEIIDNVLYATGHSTPANETTKRAALLTFVNNTYQRVCMGQFWRWMHAAYDFNLKAPYSTGTVNCTLDDATVTGNSTLWTANIAAKDIFYATSSSTVYHVSEVTTNTSLELETRFCEDTDTALSYVIARNQYKLPKETDNIKSLVVDSRYKVRLVGTDDFSLIKSKDPTRSGPPQVATLIRRDTDDDFVYMEVYPYPDKAYQCHIEYTVRILRLDDEETCYPIIPDRYRAVLFYGALSEFCGTILKDPTRAALAKADFESMWLAMKNDKQITDQMPVMMPARNYKRMRRPYGVTMSAEDFGKLDD
jgi:hypothetical protein